MSSERQLLETEGRWWGEHQHRYNEALKLTGKKDTVLDIACGTGFGTDALAIHSNGQVIGGDIADDAVKECMENWKRPNLFFKTMDGTQLPYNAEYFDTIVSFETIEHTSSYQQMILEFKRVLKAEGQLIISTPNATVSSPNGIIRNPYHTQEFTYRELKNILESQFSKVSIAGQRYCRYDRRSSKMIMTKLLEHFFLSIGIRKLPYKFRNRIMKSLTGYNLYPTAKDFILEENEKIITKECPVLFAVCKK